MRSSAVSQLPNGSSVFAVLCVSLLIVFSTATPHPFSNLLLPSEFETDGDLSDGFAISTCTKVDPALNYRPVIGILSQPGDGTLSKLTNATDASYILASYVKFVESAGARVIPLVYNEPAEVLEKKLSLVNGAIFIGGPGRNGLYYSVAEKIFKKILERNDGGDHVPLYGLAQGFQVISTLVIEDKSIVKPFNTTNSPSNLYFNKKAHVRGTVFERIPWYLRWRLGRDCIAWQNHWYGISLEVFEQPGGLSDFFQILTTSVDQDGKVYVSTANGLKYPVTIFQWDPEKHMFEWATSEIPHTEDAIEVSQKVANFLISEARKSTNKPSEKNVRDNLIYNHDLVYDGKAGKGYDQIYIFE